jgi:hypothetical protein
LSGFTPDGYCAEGVGYWNYGFGRFVLFAETLRRASGNKVDLLADDHVEAIAELGNTSAVHHGIFPTYSDCSLRAKADPDLVRFLSHFRPDRTIITIHEGFAANNFPAIVDQSNLSESLRQSFD